MIAITNSCKGTDNVIAYSIFCFYSSPPYFRYVPFLFSKKLLLFLQELQRNTKFKNNKEERNEF